LDSQVDIILTYLLSNDIRHYKTSLIVDNTTRNFLKTLGRKDQSFNDIIIELIKEKKKDIRICYR